MTLIKEVSNDPGDPNHVVLMKVFFADVISNLMVSVELRPISSMQAKIVKSGDKVALKIIKIEAGMYLKWRLVPHHSGH